MSISFPPPSALDSHPADLPSATTLGAYPCHPTTTRNMSPTASRELCPSLASCAFRSSRLLLQPMLHTSLQDADTTNTLPRHTVRSDLRLLSFLRQAPSSSQRLQVAPGTAVMQAEGPNTHINLSSLLRASYTHHPQLRKRHSGIDPKHSAIDAQAALVSKKGNTRNGSTLRVQYPWPLPTATTRCTEH